MDLVMMISRPPVTILCVMLTNERRKIEKTNNITRKLYTQASLYIHE